MPTPSDRLQNAECGVRIENPRSVFSNFKSKTHNELCADDVTARPAASEIKESAIRNPQSAIGQALARSFLHRLLAKAYEYPTEEGWGWLAQPTIHAAFRASIEALDSHDVSWDGPAGDLARQFHFANFEPFLQDYITVFGHAARGSCPLNEIEYGDLKADPLFQPHRLADLGAYYRAFGLEITDDAAERADHICVELEFVAVLAAKEAFALEHQLNALELALGREAQTSFLREHLGRWTPAFTRRLASAAGKGVLGTLAIFTQQFIEDDCRRFGVTPGSEDLVLRPVDEADESQCAGCGIRSLPPGAMTTTEPRSGRHGDHSRSNDAARVPHFHP